MATKKGAAAPAEKAKKTPEPKPEHWCEHEFIGYSEGVECARCGLQMTHEEYVAYCKKNK